jgi:ATP-dependent Lon protease
MKDLFELPIMQLSEDMDKEAEFIPLITVEEEEKMNTQEFPEELPILPLRNNVLFPGVVIPITVGRDKSIRLIQDAGKGDKIIGVVSQVNQEDESPEIKDLYSVGTVAQIIRTLKMPDGSTTVIIQGKRRFKIVKELQSEPYFRANVKFLKDKKYDKKSQEMEALFSSIKENALEIIKNSPNIPSEASFAIGNIDSPTFLVNFICSNMNADVAKKQELLEELDLKKRSFMVLEHLTMENEVLRLRNEIQNKVRNDLDKQQREYFLNQQIKTIQDELGDNPQEQEVEELQRRAMDKNWDDKIAGIFAKEMNKLQRMNPQGAEYSVQLN